MIRFSQDPQNIVDRVFWMADKFPAATALLLADGTTLTYQEVRNKIQTLRAGLQDQGLKSSDRVLVFFPFDEKFVFFIMALFAERIVPVILDPRMPRKLWKSTIQNTGLRGIFLSRKLKKFRFFLFWLNSYSLWEVEKIFQSLKSTDQDLRPTQDEEEVLITLTSGTTGQPKTIIRPFKVIKNQQLYLCRYLPEVSKDIHLSLYGMGVLQGLAEGSSMVLLPHTHHTPQRILETLQSHKVTRLSGPPGTLVELVLFLEKNHRQVLHLENIITGGAPLPHWWIKKAESVFPKASVTIMYGSTECEPISFLDSRKAQWQYPGYPVGLPIPELQFDKVDYPLSGHDIFEIALKGSNCIDVAQGFQTGDLAVQEGQQLYLLGRKSEVVGGVPVAMIEQPLEEVPGVKRVAVQKTETQFCVFFERLDKEYFGSPSLIQEVRTQAESISRSWQLGPVKVKEVKKIPVDPRHGWKIQRDLLNKA